MPLKYSSAALSDIGLVRANNEDSFKEHPSMPLWVLADGMGGHQAGEVASKEAVEAFLRLLSSKVEDPKLSPDALASEMEKAIESVNSIIYAIGMSDERLKGMGTTLVSLAFKGQLAIIAHAGDSRLYRLREGEFERLTNDHTLAFQLLEKGQIMKGDESFQTYKNVITKAIGNGQTLHPSIQLVPLKKGDRFLLASDGLTDMVKDQEIASILTLVPRLSDCVRELIHEAKRQGGIDNITAIAVQVDDV